MVLTPVVVCVKYPGRSTATRDQCENTARTAAILRLQEMSISLPRDAVITITECDYEEAELLL